VSVPAAQGRPDPAVRVALERPDQDDVVALIDALDAYQKPLYPPESHHGIDVAELVGPEVMFAVARDAGSAVACAAVVIGTQYGELKRMFVRPDRRGRGIGAALLTFLEQAARKRGCRRLMLETGILQHEALAVYVRAGFARCGPFGAYRPDPLSVFMYKDLG
jgi:putative acetyltransferase